MTCQECRGKCCTGWTIDVVAGLDDVPEHMVKQDRLLGTVMRERGGACIALKDGRCSIYEIRPQVCRQFEMGGPYCKMRQTIPWPSLLRKVGPARSRQKEARC